MQLPPEIVLKGIKTTPRIDQLMERGIASLERACDYITSTRIALEQEQARHQTGNPYRMRIAIRIPGRPEIVVKRWSKGLQKSVEAISQMETALEADGESELETVSLSKRSPVRPKKVREEPVVQLIRRTFASARRELETVVDRQHGKVKTPADLEVSAVVEKILREQGYGFLRTPEGEQVYFHRNSVLHGHWDDLAPGVTVRYVRELGQKGVQASTVEPL